MKKKNHFRIKKQTDQNIDRGIIIPRNIFWVPVSLYGRIEIKDISKLYN